MVVPNGDSLSARSRSRWIHCRSAVASANCAIRSCVIVSHSLAPISLPTCSFKDSGVSTTTVATPPSRKETPTENQVRRHINPNAPVPAAFPISRVPILRSILYALHPVRPPAAKSAHSPRHLQETCPRILPLRHEPEWPDPKRAEPCLVRQP